MFALRFTIHSPATSANGAGLPAFLVRFLPASLQRAHRHTIQRAADACRPRCRIGLAYSRYALPCVSSSSARRAPWGRRMPRRAAAPTLISLTGDLPLPDSRTRRQSARGRARSSRIELKKLVWSCANGSAAQSKRAAASRASPRVAERRGEREQAMEYLDRAGELFSRQGAKLYLDQVLMKKEILRA